MQDEAAIIGASGSKESLPRSVLLAASLCASFSTVVSVYSIVLQLKNYRKPLLQRWVVRIQLLVPIYALASMIALFSLEAAFLIDLVRDLYEAFCIYSFFSLLITYLGGERSLLLLLHGREPTPHPWPVSIFCRPLDISDPFSFLFLKRGILQYVQIKPVLAVITIILKATDTYRDGQLEGNAGYTYISVAYNFSVSLSLYCLAMFWVCTSRDLQPFRPMPKFLCVKALVFATFWQGLTISALVKSGFLRSGKYSTEHFSIALQDAILCFEMPIFALMHLYAFSHKDYLPSKTRTYSGRLPVVYAFRDSLLGYKDVLDDSLTTLRGTGFSYRTFEPAEGGLHSASGDARARRAKAGLRYADGGKTKYWLPMPGADVEEAYGRHADRGAPLNTHGYTGSDARHHLDDIVEHPIQATSTGASIAQLLANPIQTIGRAIREKRDLRRGYAPIAPEQAEEVVHDDDRYTTETTASNLAEARRLTAGVVPLASNTGFQRGWTATADDNDLDLEFGEPEGDEEDLYKESRHLEFGDYNYPIVDASKEEARQQMREMEDAFIQGRTKEWQMTRALDRWAWKMQHNAPSPSPKKGKKRLQDKSLPNGCIDLLVEDSGAEEEQATLDRERGEPALRCQEPKRIFRRTYGTNDGPGPRRPPDFPKTNSAIPGTPPMETADPSDAITKPIEAKPPPSFAKLTRLSDGSPQERDEGTPPTRRNASRAQAESGQSTASSSRSRDRYSSQEPEYNPWD